MPANARHAVVVGAGLAGAATAVALCRRGWQVSLLSAGAQLADGASALPVGMLSPHVTRRPTPMSRLTALGVPITRSELERGVPVGQGWQPVEVDNRGHDAGRHPAALVRPGALVQAWVAQALATRRLRLHLGAEVQALERTPAGWRVQGPDGQVQAEAGALVLAAALGCRTLTDALGMALPLRPVQGQMSLGPLQGAALAERPQRDDGVFVPEYRDTGLPPHWPERIWSVGSTYRRGATDTAITEAAHRENLQRLQALAPTAAQAMERAMAKGHVMGWAGVRCASLDRLPLIGAAPDPAAVPAPRVAGVHAMPRLPGLYLNCAMGSRGLALAALAGQAVAALMDGDPMPLEDDLRDAVDPARFAWRQARRGPG